MKEFEEFAGKRMPYKESDEYVAQLIAKSADYAIANKAVAPRRDMFRVWTRAAVSMAAVLLFGVLMFTKLNVENDFENYQSNLTLSEVLSSMSDDKLMCVSYYEIDEIPEYEE